MRGHAGQCLEAAEKRNAHMKAGDGRHVVKRQAVIQEVRHGQNQSHTADILAEIQPRGNQQRVVECRLIRVGRDRLSDRGRRELRRAVRGDIEAGAPAERHIQQRVLLLAACGGAVIQQLDLAQEGAADHSRAAAVFRAQVAKLLKQPRDLANIVPFRPDDRQAGHDLDLAQVGDLIEHIVAQKLIIKRGDPERERLPEFGADRQHLRALDPRNAARPHGKLLAVDDKAAAAFADKHKITVHFHNGEQLLANGMLLQTEILVRPAEIPVARCFAERPAPSLQSIQPPFTVTETTQFIKNYPHLHVYRLTAFPAKNK